MLVYFNNDGEGNAVRNASGVKTFVESVPILLVAFKNAPPFPDAELKIGGGVRLGRCLPIALTRNPHIQLNITGHFWFHFQQIPQGALDIGKHEILRHINSASIGIVKSNQQSILNYHSVFRPLLQQSTVNSQQSTVNNTSVFPQSQQVDGNI